MKVTSITIENFKLFDNLTVSFKDKELEEISDRFLILGDNGSGKTSLLQAVALPLALATGKIFRVEEFQWPGFLPSRYFQRGNSRIELRVRFEKEELEATYAIARRWWASRPASFRLDHSFVAPSQKQELTLTLDGDYWRVDGDMPEALQFKGRFYAKQLLRFDHTARDAFALLPDVFWFDQYRNLGAGIQEPTENGQEARGATFEAGVGNLRRYLVGWMDKRASGRPVPYLDQLEKAYRIFFPDRHFKAVASAPRPDRPMEEEDQFLLSNGTRDYELVEMSAGEQSIFPILYEMVRSQIAYSVVLIDELDLNLHPPLAQHLAVKLPKLSPTSQFLITTHSEAVNNVIGEEETYRIQGGALCL